MLEWLALADLKLNSPETFESADPAAYHHEALEVLRKYTRLLGASLAGKVGKARDVSAKTYREEAKTKSCDKDELIPAAEVRDELRQAGIRT